MQGEVQSHTRNKDAFKLNNTWYNMANQGAPLPGRGDTISFEPFQGQDNRWYVQDFKVIQKSQWSGGGGRGGYGGGQRQGGGKPSGGKGGYDNLGQQIGNGVTNAVHLITNGVVEVPKGADANKIRTTVASVAYALVKAGDDVRAKIENPQANANPQAQAQPAQAPQAPQPQQPAYNPQGNGAVQQPPAQPPGGIEFDDDIPFN